MKRLLPLAGLLCALAGAAPAGAQPTVEATPVSPPSVPSPAAPIPASPKAAAPSMAPLPPPPKPNLSAMKGWIGSWSCTTTSSRRPSAVTSTVTYALDPSGRWIVGTGISHPVPWYPYKGTSTDYATYDAAQKRWVDVYVDSDGNYQTSTSRGPRGNTWIWHDLGLQRPGGDIAATSDQTATVDGNEMTSDYHFKTTAGKTIEVKTRCKRLP